MKERMRARRNDMNASIDSKDFQQRMANIETLLQEVQKDADARSRQRTTAIVQSLMDLHAAALAKMLAAIGDVALIERLAHDDLIGSVLLLYGLHPLDLETRVRQALEQAGPLLRSHGGTVDLVSVTDGMVRLRLSGNGRGCPSTALTLRSAIEDAIYARAPDVTGIEIAGESDAADIKMGPRVALPLIHA